MHVLDDDRTPERGPEEEHRVSITPARRLGALALLAIIALSACSSGGASTAPSAAATTTPTTAASAPAGSAPAASDSAEPSSATGPTPPTANVTLQGAGATFPAPLYMTWFQDYNTAYPNIQIDYQANGSGAGITAITQQTVDFGASDAPMKDTEIAALPAGKKLFHFPTALGAVVVIFNLPDVQKLQLDSANIAGIFLGKITKWNDPAIAANNAGVTLPDTAIAVVHRSDGSGTTNAFTTYLDTVDPTWHAGPGAGKSVNWPVGIGASGNDGVSTAVKQTPGAIGYVDLSVAISSNLASAYVKNADGQFVPGSTDGVTAAAEAAVSTFPADFRQGPIINGAGATTYPIATYTYLLVYEDQADATKGQALVAFLHWALTDGQAAETALGYAPLPQEVGQKALTQLHLVTTGGAPIWP
jgi:phosphate transport system substrate-binding protein